MRAGARALIVPGLLMQAFGFGWMVHLAATFAHYTSFVIPFVIAGVGISMALPSVSPGGLNAVPQDLLGKAAGTLNTMQQFGALFGVAVITAVFTAHGSLATSAAVTSGYRAALAASACASVLGAVAGVGIRRARAAGADQVVERGTRGRGVPELGPAWSK